MDEFEVGAGFWTGGEGAERGEDGCIFVDVCSGYSDQQSCITAS